MTLIKSISGIRGTIGGAAGDNLTPADVVKFTSAYARWLGTGRKKVVVGRDARPSGAMVEALVKGTLMGCGVDVVDLGLCTTPGVEMAVADYGADGGIIITASHNPVAWNALKLLDARGEFLDAAEGARVLELSENEDFSYPAVADLGCVVVSENYDQKHIDAVLALPLVDVAAVRARGFKVALDAVNSVGGVVMPQLLERMGVEVVCVNCEPTGQFAHNPEPLAENLRELSDKVVAERADLGIAVDPDVDRLALVCEDGTMFGEEYTLVAAADYVLTESGGGATVSNLSSTRALRDVTLAHGGTYSPAAVGEVNVVAEMKRTGAIIGGEGNGGVIYPALHYGRDALVGVALILTWLARKNMTASELRDSYPKYNMIKEKLTVDDPAPLLASVAARFANEKVDLRDGVKIDFADGWVHLRRSNTEPIVRIYAEAATPEAARELVSKILNSR
jgi:phosphomannomutase